MRRSTDGDGIDAARIGGASGRSEWSAGWPMLLASTISFALSSIPMAAVGVLVKPLGQDFGWSRAEMSLALLLTAFGTLTMAPVVGPLIDRIGPRRVALRGMILVSLGTISIGLAGPSITSWYAGWALYAIAQTFSNSVVWSNAVISRFDRNRGKALALYLTIQALTFGGVPITALWILGEFGWRWIFFATGLGSLVIGWPLTWWLFYARRDLDPVAVAPETASRGRFGIATIREAGRTRIFWQIAISFAIAAASISAMLIHLQPVLIDAGITPTRAAMAVFMAGPASVAGRLLTGILLDRCQLHLIAAMTLLFPATAYALLLFIAKSEGAAIVIALCIGFAAGAETDLLAYAVSRYFRSGSFSSIYALLLGIYAVGYGVAPVLAGGVFDRTGSYAPVFATLMMAALMGAGLLLALGRPNARSPI
jgi:predicted MFS family arabinose efflux permease